MQLNAINSVNFKANNSPKIDFDKEIQNLKTSEKLLSDNEDMFVDKDKKGAIATATVVTYAATRAAVKGASAAYVIDKTLNNKVSEGFDNLLKRGSELSKKTADSLISNTGKFKKLAKTTGRALESTVNFASKTFKRVAGESKIKGLTVASAIVSALTFVPIVCLKDDNKDGIKDIAQKSQNVYKSRAEKIDKTIEKAEFLSKITQLLT